MTPRRNDLGQPIGDPVAGWTTRPHPSRTPMIGHYCRLEPLDAARHAAPLYESNGDQPDARAWTYLAYGPFETLAGYRQWLTEHETSEDPLFFTIVAEPGGPVGLASYLRIDPVNGVIEVGHLNYSPRLQRTRAATEAMFLMMRRAFDELGYRRYEWKCDSLNEPSRLAALRLGFTYEGMFRQAVVYKGRNRDTAWYSIVDGEWPALRTAYERWLDAGNFDDAGRQRRRLPELIEEQRNRR